MGLLDEFKKLEAETPPEVLAGKKSPAGAWHKICVCGHQEKYHSEEIGGIYPAREEIPGKRWKTINVAHGCGAEIRGRGHTPYDRIPNADKTELTVIRAATCPCTEFRAVAEARDPRFRFRQRRPINRAIGGRDYSAQRHAFVTGIRATMTSINNLKRVQDPDLTDRQREELIEQIFDEKFRWLPATRQCWVGGCDATEDVWPVYVNDQDLSELRCPEHRP